MVAWIFDDGEYQAQYHVLFSDFLSSVDITQIIDTAAELIATYVERDPSNFCTYEEFKQGVETLRTFCTLRAQSIRGQLDGTIPSTTEGQNSDSAALIDASNLVISDMGSMQQGMGAMRGGFGGNREMQESTMMPPEWELPQMNFPQRNGEMPENYFIRQRDGMNTWMPGGIENAVGRQEWLWVGISAVVLLLGLLLTRLFRRK